jgi:FlaA1/EpsC-like NDP-sugar epimerase
MAECVATEPDARWQPTRDETLLPALLGYVRASRARLGDMDDRIAVLLAGTPELIVWGTGQTARELLAETALGRARVVAFADSNPLYRGRQLAGAPVVAPEELGAYTQPILVGSIVSQAAIVERATELGLRDRLLLLDPTSPSA